jgi:nucleotide-binding universal stress UspA family protein
MSAQSVPVPEAAILRTILFPSDLSAESAAAFAHARLLAQRFTARLTLCHFLAGRRDGLPRPEEVFRREHDAARSHLDGLAQELEVARRTTVFEAYDVPRALVRHIRGTRPDLTVMATHGRMGLARLVLGSVTEAVIRHGVGPVLCVRPPEHGTALPYRRILFPTDFTKGSRRALPWVKLLAGAFDAEVVAIHAAPFPTLASLPRHPSAEHEVPTPMDLRSFLEPDLPGLRLTVRVPWGPPVVSIVDTARRERADLIVMATHGYDSVGDRLRGTHTERLIRLAPCPVLAL